MHTTREEWLTQATTELRPAFEIAGSKLPERIRLPLTRPEVRARLAYVLGRGLPCPDCRGSSCANANPVFAAGVARCAPGFRHVLDSRRGRRDAKTRRRDGHFSVHVSGA